MAGGGQVAHMAGGAARVEVVVVERSQATMVEEIWGGRVLVAVEAELLVDLMVVEMALAVVVAVGVATVGPDD